MPAMQPITVNTDTYTLRLAREALEEQLFSGFGALDAKRPRAWDQYGYSPTVSFEQLRMAYSRGGPGHGAVHRILDRCWMHTPRIKAPASDAETPFEAAIGAVMRKLWIKLRGFDRRNMVGRYAGLIYRIADNKTPDQPVGRGVLVDIVPAFEDQLRVSKWDEDQNSPTFGEPVMWEFCSRSFEQNVGAPAKPTRWQKVHPSRVQLLAEGSEGDFTDGVPLLLAGFNHLVDLEKISGGSAESFLKNSARTVVLSFDPGSNPQQLTTNPDGTPTGQTLAQAVEEKTSRLNRSIDASIVTAGGTATTLQTTISDPTGAWMLAANLFAASVQVPFTILFGQQTGRLASDEDKTDFNVRCASRRANLLTPMLEEFITRMQAVGAIEQGEFEIEWPSLDEPGDKEKGETLRRMTGAMKEAFDCGVTNLFLRDELRAVLDYEPMKEGDLPNEGEGQDEEDTAPMPRPAALPMIRRTA